jgi:hypothetical protein
LTTPADSGGGSLDLLLQFNLTSPKGQFCFERKFVMNRFCALCSVVLLAPAAVVAQEVPRYSFSGGAGFVTPVNSTGSNLDTGWNISGGAGVNLNSHLGVMLDIGYNSMGVNSAALNNLGFAGGRLSVFSATIDPIVHLMPKGRVDVYVTGGGGYYRQNQDFSQPGVIYGTGFNPFFGFYPVAVPGNVVVSSYSVNKPGFDVGAGVSFGNKWGGKFFAEARYNRIFTGTYYTEYLPVTFGFRK